MSTIEIIICLILLFMGIPDLCKKWGRPALAYSAFVLFGLLLGLVAHKPVVEMLIEAGKVGFLLLLFEVGLEIDLPPLREFVRPVRYAFLWCLVQYPILWLLAVVAGLDYGQAMLAASALAACSVGMAHAAWKDFGGLEGDTKAYVLQVMVALEMTAIVFLAVEMAAVEKGNVWGIVLKLIGMAIVIGLVSRFASHLDKLFQIILEKTTQWRVHFLVLLVLAICAVGERLGLSAAKTAFFLGLFMSRSHHAGLDLQDHMAPISKRFLIPVFFVALGLQIPVAMLFSLTTVLALGAAFLILGLREIIHRRWLKTGGAALTYLLFCPNLTLVALAASVLLEKPEAASGAVWLLMTGLFMTIPSVLMLPRQKTD